MTLPTGAALEALLAAPRRHIVKALVQRTGHGKHRMPASAELSLAAGLVGDRWSVWRPSPKRQLTLMDERVIVALLRALDADAPTLIPADDQSQLHRPGDNLVLDFATSLAALPAGTRLRVGGGGATIEVNDVPHLGCAKFEERFGAAALAWVNAPEHAPLRLRGVHAVVVSPGVVAVGDAIEVVS